MATLQAATTSTVVIVTNPQTARQLCENYCFGMLIGGHRRRGTYHEFAYAVDLCGLHDVSDATQMDALVHLITTRGREQRRERDEGDDDHMVLVQSVGDRCLIIARIARSASARPLAGGKRGQRETEDGREDSATDGEDGDESEWT